ncbi:hypothetical protein M569_00043 [Genlisea aurea]|uniref:Uncharacterized protein n=1 Tax=Genlisea aurea TaxID=192259 RepID=S8EFA3_9LAMI|nr:hypothetical protein M569_00043 [Genlisea aurea]
MIRLTPFIRDRNAHASENYLQPFHGLGCQARPFDLVSLSSQFVLPVWQLSGAYEVSVVAGQPILTFEFILDSQIVKFEGEVRLNLVSS